MQPVHILMAISVPVIWGFGFTFSKAALAEFPPLLLSGLRYCLTALILIWFAKWPGRDFGRIVLIALVGSVVQYGLTFTGLKYLDASTAVLIIQLEVPFGVIAAWLAYREYVGWVRVLGILLSFVGVGFIAGSPSVSGQWFAVGLVIGGALTWAIAQVMVKTLRHTQGFSLIAWLAVIAGPIMIAASLGLESGHAEALQNATWIGWGTLLYLGFIMTALAYGLFYKLLALFPVSRIMPYLLLLPVAGVLGSMLFLGERPSSMVLLGGVIVVSGVTLIEIFGNPKSAKEQ